MVASRKCSRPLCQQSAVSTLTYVYAQSTAVLGPLATYPEPHCYDLCESHAKRLKPPHGWELVTLHPDPSTLRPTEEELTELASAIRETTLSVDPNELQHGARRGHLRVIRD
jgi:hypothetical protein